MTERQVQRYSDYAAECLRLAQETNDPGHKARLLEMADAWRRLSETMGKREPGSRGS
jgi:hypothetical protein